MNIGVILSGGMAKGAYQIGALRAILEYIPLSEIRYLSCSSVGALNGFAFAAGKLDDAEAIWKAVCVEQSKLRITQILRGNQLAENIHQIADGSSGLNKVLYCTLFDVKQRILVYKNLSAVPPESISLYLRASVALPVYNRAVCVDNTAYYDGAMIDNIPVFPLMRYSLDYLICVYFDETGFRFENLYFDNKIIKLCFTCESAISQSLIFRQDRIDAMIQEGYEQASRILSDVCSAGYSALEPLYQKIEERNRQNRGPMRVSGDLIVSNINKVVQKLTSRRIEP